MVIPPAQTGPLDAAKATVFLLAGVVLLVAAGYSAYSTRDFIASSLVVPGIVVAEPYGPHHVQVRFRTRAGQTVTYGQNGWITLHTGERVRVRYDARHPRQDPSVDQWPALWGGTLGLGGLGGFFAIVGATSLARRGRSSRKRRC